jgi:DNA (cytosine-5)-methyltransferase 1
MEWDAPAPTITTQYFGFGNGRFGHPEQDRAITLREGAILQTFPKKYVLEPPNEHVSAQRIGRLIGNAVPPKLAQYIGKAIVDHLIGVDG